MSARACDSLAVEVGVAQRFNAYAQAAFPLEIAGLLRIVRKDGDWVAIDLAVPPQRASSATFALDGVAIARWCLDLHAAGREHEVGEWRGLVHSHPSMPADPSPLDLRTLIAFAGDGFAFSVICSAQRDPRRNRYSCLYAQGGITRDIGARPADGTTLAGVESLPAGEVEAIAAEVERLLVPETEGLHGVV